ncbi:MAG: hypothetical protein KJS95_08275 [Gammaproteobacteria bacterium]|nr:hypothetical protein [Gammaproteobacteria bacterium]
MHGARPTTLLPLAVAAAIGLTSLPALAAGPFTPLIGTWSGSGQARLDGGRTETLKCKAYYTDRGAGSAIGISLRCASASARIELRANLTSSAGSISGSWEERQYNAVGSVSGQASGNRVNLSITGGGLSGSMSVTTSGGSQSVSITTAGTALRGVNIGLSRD